MRTKLILAILISAFPLLAFAQDEPPDFTAGLRPYDSFHGGQIDSVSMTTGSLTIHAPFWSFPQRGGKLSLDYSLVYNGLNYWIWSHCNVHDPSDCTYAFKVRGSKYGVNVEDLQLLGTNTHWLKQGASGLYLYSITTRDGTTHSTGYLGSGAWRTFNATGYKLDQTNFILNDGAGTRYTALSGTSPFLGKQFFNTREDPNGNQITRNPTTFATTDTIGRVIPAIPYWNGGTSGVLSDSSGCTGPRPIAEARIWYLPSPNGGTTAVKFCRVNVTIRTNFPEGYQVGSQFTSTFSMTQSIVLPNGKAWTFEYDDRDPGDISDPNNPNYVNYGQLTKITFPLGGSISYVWHYAGEDTSGNPLRVPISRILNANDGQGNKTWTYTWAFPDPYLQPFTNAVTDPQGNDTVVTATGFPSSGAVNATFYETQSQYFQGSRTSGTLLKTTNTDYQYSTCSLSTAGCPPVIGVVPIRVKTVWANGQTSKVEKDYDGGFSVYAPASTYYLGNCIYGKSLTQREYDYGSGTAGALLRTTNTSYLALSNSTYLSFNLLDLVSSSTILDGGGTQRAQTQFYFDQYTLSSSGVSTQHNSNPVTGAYRGNRTTVSRWLNTTSGYIGTATTFFDTGMPYQTTDPLNHTTIFGYGSGFAGAYLTQTTNALSQSSSRNYDWNTGLTISSTDPNNKTISYSYDVMGRIGQVNFPDSGQRTFAYNDSASPPNMTLTTKISSSQNMLETGIVDGFGRMTQRQLNSDPQGAVYTLTSYDSLGRKATVTNPYRTTSDPTYGFTTYQYDALGRVTTVTGPDNTSVMSSYTGNTTTVTDQAGKQRKSFADGLGRLIEVDEPNPTLSTPAITSYTYDALDNLLAVLQSGSRQRTFTYNSFSQLTQSYNPEAGTINYTYDNDGNLYQKTDARSIVTTHTYDALNRLTVKSYSDATLPAFFTYDESGSANPVGRLTSFGTWNSGWATASVFNYDVMGRVTTQCQITPGSQSSCFWTTGAYDLAGNLTALTYPSGRKVNSTFNNAARLTAVTYVNSGGSPIMNYLGSASYAAHGAPTSMILGNNLTEATQYNNRLQACRFDINNSNATLTDCNSQTPSGSFLDKKYDFGTTNNGNVMAINDQLNAGRTQAFTYDQLNRLLTAASSASSGSDCWGLQFAYDIWANLTSSNVTKCSTPSATFSVNANNQITNAGFSYDAAGDLLSDGSFTYQWDAESRMKSLNTTATTYTYDANGSRVRKQTGTDFTEYLSFGGQTIAERNADGSWSDYIFAGGKRIAKADNFEDRILLAYTRCSNCGYQYADFYWTGAAAHAGYTIRSGDKLYFRQYQVGGSRGGPWILFTDNSNTAWTAYDQDGQISNDDGISGSWHYRRIDLSAYAGKTINLFVLRGETDSAAGANYIYFEDISLVSTDGTVQTYYNRAKTVSLYQSYTNGMTGVNAVIDHAYGDPSWFPISTQFYHGDHLGSSRQMSTYYGFPVWEGTYLPFGQEWNAQATVNHYKFTGKERDAESGLDYFGARFYSSQYSRFVTPDWSSKPTTVPYAQIGDPQSLNLYTYVRNNPLRFVDVDGHECMEGEKGCTSSVTYSEQSARGTLYVTQTDQTTHTLDDGSKVVTETKTVLAFSTSQDHVGEFTASQHITTTSYDSNGKETGRDQSHSFITNGMAQDRLGARLIRSYQDKAMPSRAEFYNRAIRNDSKGQAHVAIGIAILFVPVAEAWGVVKAVGDVLLGAHELAVGVHDARKPQEQPKPQGQ